MYRELVLLATVSARDPDAGENGTVRFSLEQCGKSASFAFPPAARVSSASASASASEQALLLQQPQRLFTIDEESGKLWLLQGELDRDALSDPGAGICVRVRAVDMGRPTSRSSALELVLEVLDENDNPPRLESNRTLVCGAGCATTGITLRATDPDSGPNGTVVYTLANQSPLFSLDRHTGTLTLAPTRPLSLPLQSLSQSPSSSGSDGGASGPGSKKLDPLLGPHVLRVNLSDCGSPARSTLESITVLVTVDAIALAASSEEPNFARTVLVALVLLALLLFLAAFAVSFAVCRILQRSQHERSHGILQFENYTIEHISCTRPYTLLYVRCICICRGSNEKAGLRWYGAGSCGPVRRVRSAKLPRRAGRRAAGPRRGGCLVRLGRGSYRRRERPAV